MKVLMLKDVKGVAQRGAIIEVSDGYALNALIPSGKAVHATADKIAAHAKREKLEAAAREARDAQTAAKIRALEGKTFTIKAPVNDKGHLFKGMHKNEIARAIGVDEDAISGVGDVVKDAKEYALTIESAGARAAVTLLITGK